jgi:hypothetical protein
MEATAPTRSVPREPVAGTCPACGAAEIARYPVVSTGGWFIVEKCQRCLTSVHRTRWNRLGSVDRDHAHRVVGAVEQATR